MEIIGTIIILLLFTLAMGLVTNLRVLYDSTETEQRSSNSKEIRKERESMGIDTLTSSAHKDERRDGDINSDNGSPSHGPEPSVRARESGILPNGSDLRVRGLSDTVTEVIDQFCKERSFYYPTLSPFDIGTLSGRLTREIGTALAIVRDERIEQLEAALAEATAELGYATMKLSMEDDEVFAELDRAYQTIKLLLANMPKQHAEFTEADYNRMGKYLNMRTDDGKTVLQLTDGTNDL